jgi:hypothetical protein
MADQDQPDAQFDAMTARLLHREALRRAANEVNTTSGPGLEGVLARISAEVTAAAASCRAAGVEATEVDASATHSTQVRPPSVPRPKS